MATRQTKPREFGWTLAQRRALLALLAVLLVWLTVQYARHRSFVSDPQPAGGSRAEELASRIDPNSADWQTLAAIPTLGPKRAKDIVAYRDRVRLGDANAVAYRTAADLLRIRGIGGATVENLRPYLIFPADSPATQSNRTSR